MALHSVTLPGSRQQVYDVKSLGGACNGTTDDTATVNSIVTTAAAAGGGHIQFPAGTTRIAGTITGAKGVTIGGAGKDKTTLLVDDVAGAVINYPHFASTTALGADVNVGDKTVTLATGGGAHFAAGDTVYLQDANTGATANPNSGSFMSRVISIATDVLTIEDACPVTITAANTGQAWYWGADQPWGGCGVSDLTIKISGLAAEAAPVNRSFLIQLTGCYAPSVERVRVLGANSGAVALNYCKNGIVRDCVVDNVYPGASISINECTGTTVAENRLRLSTFGITADSSPYTVIALNQIHGMNSTWNGRGIKVQSGSNGSIIIGNTISDNRFYGIYVSDSSYCHVGGNRIFATGKNDTSEHGIVLNGYMTTTEHHNVIEGNIISGVTGAGIDIGSAPGGETLAALNVIVNNIVQGCAGSIIIATSQNLVTGNVFDTPSGINTSLIISSSATKNVIQNNIFNQASNVAISSGGSGGANIFQNNTIQGAATTSYNATDLVSSITALAYQDVLTASSSDATNRATRFRFTDPTSGAGAYLIGDYAGNWYMGMMSGGYYNGANVFNYTSTGGTWKGSAAVLMRHDAAIAFKTIADASAPTAPTDRLLITNDGRITALNSRIQTALGSAVASANNLSLGASGNLFHITGTTQINLLDTTNWQAGSVVTLIFDGALTVKHNQTVSGTFKPILLNGSADYATAINGTLRLEYDGTNWYESGRKT